MRTTRPAGVIPGTGTCPFQWAKKRTTLAIKDWLFHACVPGWTSSARAVSVFQTKVMIVPTRIRIILWPGKTTGDSPAIFNKRSAFKCSDSEHNNQDSRFSRGKLPTPEHRVLDSK